MSAHAKFVHLRVQSAYSMLEGSMRPADIARACELAGVIYPLSQIDELMWLGAEE
jgi:DNA polymerase III alpha subunit